LLEIFQLVASLSYGVHWLEGYGDVGFEGIPRNGSSLGGVSIRVTHPPLQGGLGQTASSILGAVISRYFPATKVLLRGKGPILDGGALTIVHGNVLGLQWVNLCGNLASRGWWLWE
jgi:hypothetical protein